MRNRPANPVRGEASLIVGGETMLVRPSFAALVAAEAEAGPLLGIAQRAGQGHVTLAEIEALLWHCLADRPASLSRERLGEALLAMGMTAAMPALRTILRQVLAGNA